MASLGVAATGQIRLKGDLPQYLGPKPGERVGFEKLPDGALRVRAARPSGVVDGFLYNLDGKVKVEKPLSIEDINQITAARWAGDLDQA